MGELIQRRWDSALEGMGLTGQIVPIRLARGRQRDWFDLDFRGDPFQGRASRPAALPSMPCVGIGRFRSLPLRQDGDGDEVGRITLALEASAG